MLASSSRDTHFSVIRVNGVRSAQLSVCGWVHREVLKVRSNRRGASLRREKKKNRKGRTTDQRETPTSFFYFIITPSRFSFFLWRKFINSVHYFQTHTCTHMYTQTGETGAWRVTWMNLIVCYSCVITPMKGLFHTHTRTCTEVLCVLYSWVVYKGVHVGHCWACTAQTTSTSHLDT